MYIHDPGVEAGHRVGGGQPPAPPPVLAASGNPLRATRSHDPGSGVPGSTPAPEVLLYLSVHHAAMYLTVRLDDTDRKYY